MYCSTCANQITPGLSFCNRCGTNLKDRNASQAGVGPVAAFLTAITLIGICGLGIMLGGSMALRNEARLNESVVVLYMFLTFLVVLVTEIMLVRQLSRITNPREPKQLAGYQPTQMMPNEIRAADQRGLPEPVASVTENTTRTLEYAHKELLPR